MILLYSQVGELSEEQLDFLVDNLEEEWPEDRDYYINRAMLDMLKARGADATLLRMLTQALGDREEVDILWVDTEELEEEDGDGF
jgi:processive 1,2-diacylglycerol beta-glucosyltransferase